MYTQRVITKTRGSIYVFRRSNHVVVLFWLCTSHGHNQPQHLPWSEPKHWHTHWFFGSPPIQSSPLHKKPAPQQTMTPRRQLQASGPVQKTSSTVRTPQAIVLHRSPVGDGNFTSPRSLLASAIKSMNLLEREKDLRQSKEEL